jgi:2-hydroxy-3-oxopropionate reductase
MEKIGFIGLGIMGKPMAINLLKAGYQLIVYDIDYESVQYLVRAGAKEGKSSQDVASESDIIITMLPNSPEVKEAVLGKDGVIHGVRFCSD